MKRTTVVTLVLFVALLSVWWLRTNATPTPALTPLTIGRSHAAAAALGALWGFGHCVGQAVLGLAMVLLTCAALRAMSRREESRERAESLG